mmetsp:Transcript_19437/g.45454  ORF Transcript_19437/g.45454 Transcript_19437/m.45454 type:complete len:145 (-) Transcript_19437:111-545(-)
MNLLVNMLRSVMSQAAYEHVYNKLVKSPTFQRVAWNSTQHVLRATEQGQALARTAARKAMQEAGRMEAVQQSQKLSREFTQSILQQSKNAKQQLGATTEPIRDAARQVLEEANKNDVIRNTSNFGRLFKENIIKEVKAKFPNPR